MTVPNDQMEKLHDLITNVRLDLRELNTKVDGIKDLSKKVESVDKDASEALQSTRSAHKRLDEISESIKWAWRTIYSSLAISIVGAIIKYFVK